MKLFNEITIAILTLCLMVAIPDVSFAEKKTSPDVQKMKKTKNPNILYDSKTDQYYDKREKGFIGEIYRVEGGKVVESISVEDYLEQAEETEPKEVSISADEISILSGPYVYSRYTESTNTETRFYGSRASIIQENPGPKDDTFALQYGYSKSHSGNISLSTEKTSALKAGVSYTYTVTESVSSTHSMTIPAGYSGYWRFDPRMRKTTGTMRNYLDGVLMSAETARVYYPTRINGDLDGWLVAVKQPL